LLDTWTACFRGFRACWFSPNTVEHTMLAPSRKAIVGQPRVLPTFRGAGGPSASIRRGAPTRPPLPVGEATQQSVAKVPRPESASRATPPVGEANAT